MNIILLVSDTYRYDNLFDRARMPVRTPNLDRFATERAVSVDGHHTGSFPTIPQRTDMTSGRLGWPWYGWQNLDLSTKNHLPGILRQAGYASQLLCDCPHLFNAGFQFGFDAAMAIRGQEGDVPFLRLNHPIQEVMPHAKTRPGAPFRAESLADLHSWTNRNWRIEEDRFPARTARTAVEWLEENYRGGPFFLWVDFFDPHEPWDPPEYMVKRYDPDYDGTPMIHPNYGKASDYTEAELRNLRAHYCAEAELVDRWVGRILQKIDDLQLWDDTIVVFTTDHGFSLGENNRTGKTNINPGDDRIWPIYPDVAHIPLLVAAPGLAGGATAHTLSQPEDILPTLLDLAGLDVETPEPLHGKSLAPVLKGESADPVRDLAVAGSFLAGRIGDGVTTPVAYSDDWIYVPVGVDRKVELYDRKADPYAETNVAADHPAAVQAMHEAFVAFLAAHDAPEETMALFR